jgi:hypothetical protein
MDLEKNYSDPNAAVSTLLRAIDKVCYHKQRAAEEFNHAVLSQARLLQQYDEQISHFKEALRKLRPDISEGHEPQAYAAGCGSAVGGKMP